MIPAETNKEVAEYTMADLLSAVPIRFGLRSFVVIKFEVFIIYRCYFENKYRSGCILETAVIRTDDLG